MENHAIEFVPNVFVVGGRVGCIPDEHFSVAPAVPRQRRINLRGSKCCSLQTRGSRRVGPVPEFDAAPTG